VSVHEIPPPPPINGAEAPTAPPRLVGSLYVEFLGRGQVLEPRVLGHIPDNAAVACADILTRIAEDMRSRGSRIIRPLG
jgi:hypothetical protein